MLLLASKAAHSSNPRQENKDHPYPHRAPPQGQTPPPTYSSAASTSAPSDPCSNQHTESPPRSSLPHLGHPCACLLRLILCSMYRQRSVNTTMLQELTTRIRHSPATGNKPVQKSTGDRASRNGSLLSQHWRLAPQARARQPPFPTAVEIPSSSQQPALRSSSHTQLRSTVCQGTRWERCYGEPEALTLPTAPACHRPVIRTVRSCRSAPLSSVPSVGGGLSSLRPAGCFTLPRPGWDASGHTQ